MSTSLQSKPVFQLLLNDAQFRAVGHVTAQWAFLESEINTEIRWLVSRSEHRGKKINYQARFSLRVTKWLVLARRTYRKKPALIHAVERISGRAIKIKPERDNIAHGKMTATGTFLKSRNGQLVSISDTFGAATFIEDLACRIASINADLFKHQQALDRFFRNRP